MCIIWGIPYLMIRVAVRELAPVTMVFLRTGIAAALLVPLAARRGELRPLIAGWRPLLAYTAIEVALPWYLLGHAETELTSSLTGLLIAAVPLVGALIVTLSAERARLGLRRWLGLLVGIVGVGAIVGLDIGNIDLLALGEVALVAVCYAVGPLILARRMGGLPALVIVAVSLALSAVSMHRLRPPTGRLRSRPRTWSSPSRPRGRLLGGGLPDLLRVDQGGGPGACDGDDVRESGGCSGARRYASERVADCRHGDRVRARASGLHPGNRGHPRNGRGAVA
jgi:drug/metabolite transporter (DMT)-like permease